MLLQENVILIREKYGVEYLLRQLAEECGELNVAILQLIRAMRRERSVSNDDAWRSVKEEIADVQVSLECLCMAMMSDRDRTDVDLIASAKANRMVERLLGGEGYASNPGKACPGNPTLY